MASEAPQREHWPIASLETVDSTNLEALRRAAAGERGPVWIVASKQTAGRGRAGRAWTMGSGNLAATVLLAPDCGPGELHQLSLLTGVAVHDALSGFLNPSAVILRVKWPNDILLGDAKLGGILIESTSSRGIAMAAIGIGINISDAPPIDGRATASLSDCGAAATPLSLLASIDEKMQHWIDVWQGGKCFGAVREAWLARAGAIGQPISVNTGREIVSGVFAGIDETGALLVGSVPTNSGSIRRFTFGDVSFVRSGHSEGSE